MASSQKQFTIDSKETMTEDKEAPVDVMNIMLEYDDFDKVIGHGLVPLVPTLFNSIKSQKSERLKHLLIAIVNGNLDETKAILEKDPSLLQKQLRIKMSACRHDVSQGCIQQ